MQPQAGGGIPPERAAPNWTDEKVDELDWEDALAELRNSGWDVDEINAACLALVDACCDGEFAGSEVRHLSRAQMRKVIGHELEYLERETLLYLCSVYDREDEDEDGAALRDALSDGDIFDAEED
jgi:hypothetical protein